MRVTKEKAAENRERILKAAAQLIRERGIAGAGVDTLAEAAGMTYGSLYSQFGSKERLVEEALQYALATSGKRTGGTVTLDQFVAGYLAPEHRSRVGQGCPLAALACEVPRQGAGVKAAFTAGLKGMVERLSSRMSLDMKARQREEQALATVASLIGALILARAVDDEELSDNILRATKKQLNR